MNSIPNGWHRPIRMSNVRPRLPGFIPQEAWLMVGPPALWVFGVLGYGLGLYLFAVLYFVCWVATSLDPFWLAIGRQVLSTSFVRIGRTWGRYGKFSQYLAAR